MIRIRSDRRSDLVSLTGNLTAGQHLHLCGEHLLPERRRCLLLVVLLLPLGPSCTASSCSQSRSRGHYHLCVHILMIGMMM
jgi:hypothetical protein